MSTTPHKTYRIERISDFQKVPDDRLLECLTEVAECILETRALAKDGIQTECVTWTDDGIVGISGADLHIGDQVERVDNPNFPGEQP